MGLYAVNVLVEQFNVETGVLTLPRFSLNAALQAAGREVLLHATRQTGSGYYASAILGEPLPGAPNSGKILIPLYQQCPLQRPMTTSELRALNPGEMPFHIFSRPIREIEDDEQSTLVRHAVIPAGFGESEVQPFTLQSKLQMTSSAAILRQLRFEMFDAYGTSCAFTGRSYPSLDGLRFGTDMGHLLPRSEGGPDILSNIMPMCKDVNNLWDEGLISLANKGAILIASGAGPDIRALFEGRTRAAFPDPKFWPDVQYLECHRDTIFEQGPRWARTS